MRGRPALPALILMLLLSACGGDLQTPGEALRIFGESVPQAFAGEPYSAPIRAVGGLRPFAFEVTDGRLPPGTTMRNGVVEGVPTEVGVFEFTVVVSDANLSRTFRDYTLTVVERPPPRLIVSAPLTEVRGPTTIRISTEHASELRAVSMVISWDSESFELTPGSTDAVSGAAALWRSDPGTLQVDVAALGRSWNDDRRLLTFELTPLRTAVPKLSIEASFLDDRGGRHLQAEPATSSPPAPASDTAFDVPDGDQSAGEQSAGEQEADGESDEPANGTENEAENEAGSEEQP